MTKFEKELEEIIVDCLITGGAERDIQKGKEVHYGNPLYYVDQVKHLFATTDIEIPLTLKYRLQLLFAILFRKTVILQNAAKSFTESCGRR